MTSIAFRRRTLLVLAAVVAFLPVPASAEPVPGQQDGIISQVVAEWLHQAHLSRPQLDQEMSKKVFRRFLKDLDPTKLYFLKSDVDELARHELRITAELRAGNTSFAHEVYKKFIQRVTARAQLALKLVDQQHDFTVKESLDTDYDKLDYAADDAEVQERWRKRIKFDLLVQRLEKKPPTEAEARKKVRDRYSNLLKRWQQLDGAELLELYLSSLTNCVDPHSTYLSPASLDDFDISMRLQLDGIGALLRQENGHTIIAEVIAGGAAAADGRLKPNDKIVGVAQDKDEFEDVVDMKLRDVVKRIRGQRGTRVRLKVLPADKNEAVVYELTRQKIELKDQEARFEVLEHGKRPDGKPHKIGVIDLPSFYADMKGNLAGDGGGAAKSATADVRKILKQFEQQGVDGVVLDLRRNGGGALSEARSLTGLFIDRGPIVQVKGFRGRVEVQNDPHTGVAYGGPLVVLVSRLSASASEILAGALQDYNRALIVGDSATHGKGTVQQVVDLGSQLRPEDPPKLGALKLTIQQFYRVNGDSTQVRGVASDVVVPSVTEHLGLGEKELDNALAFDHVKPTQHENTGQISPQVREQLRSRSAERIKGSTEFAKLAKDAELLKARKERKSLPLNEAELKEQFNKEDAAKAEQKAEGLSEDEPGENKKTGPYKFTRNYINTEVLSIMQDFLQARK